MTATLNPSRYAHCEGHTGVCFSHDARYIITCGGEGDIRIWTGIEDDEATDKCVGEKAFAVCQKGDKLYVGTDNNSVQALTFPEAELDGVVARFTAPVVHIDASSDGSTVVSASCDMTIGVTNTENATTNLITGHRAPVLTVSLDPKLDYLASSSCDGTVRVWRLRDLSQVTSWDCVPKSNSWHHAPTLCRPAWLPTSGTLLAVPFPSQRQVRLYQRDSWDQTLTFSDPSIGEQMFSVVDISVGGRYLAASTTQGHIIVWNMSTQSVVASLQTDERQHICSLAWSTELLQIAFCDTNGNFGTVDMADSHSGEELRPEDIPIADPVFEDDEDDENAISLEKIKNESGFLADEDLQDKPTIDDEDGRSSRVSDVAPAKVMPAVELQPPFQPSSTPVTLQYRYMVWNDIGIVKQINTEEENVIDIEFHDTNLHHAFRVSNILGHTLATLSSEALVMACEAGEDSPSKLVCVTLNAWDGTREWTAQLPADEEALCVASGRGFVACATDTRLLRLFTTCGTQREVLCMPGPVVCLAAQQNSLAVVFHSGTGLSGDQCLSYYQLSTTPGGGSLLTRPTPPPRALPLSPRAHLRWLGYSDEGSLCSVDEAGLLRKLTPSGLWAPLCNVDSQCKGKSDHHFVVGVCEAFQTIRSVLCKGAFYPPTTPRPTVVEISWQVPLCEEEGEKSGLEQQLWQSNLALPALDSNRDAVDKTINKTLLKLFALACQSGHESRALGLCQLMPPDVVNLAVKYASKLGRTQLANKISETPQPQEEDDYVEESSSEFHHGSEGDRNQYGGLASQDMFASEESNPVPQNPILALKQRHSKSADGSTLTGVMKRENPFRKSGTDKEEADKGLAGLVRQTPVAKTIRRVTSEPVVKKVITTNENKPKKNVFMEWFSSQKESLEEEFPDLNTSELTKVALKRFKEDQKPKTNNPSVKKFFGSTTNHKNIQKTKNSPITEVDTEEIEGESKKRKNCDDEELQPKKQSVASKLKMFSYVKP